jgi:hypothetical protein
MKITGHFSSVFADLLVAIGVTGSIFLTGCIPVRGREIPGVDYSQIYNREKKPSVSYELPGYGTANYANVKLGAWYWINRMERILKECGLFSSVSETKGSADYHLKVNCMYGAPIPSLLHKIWGVTSAITLFVIPVYETWYSELHVEIYRKDSYLKTYNYKESITHYWWLPFSPVMPFWYIFTDNNLYGMVDNMFLNLILDLQEDKTLD